MAAVACCSLALDCCNRRRASLSFRRAIVSPLWTNAPTLTGVETTWPDVCDATSEVSVAVRLPVASIVVGTSCDSARAVVTGIAAASSPPPPPPPRPAPPSPRLPLFVEVVFEVVVVFEQPAPRSELVMMMSAQLVNIFERALRERKVNTMIDLFYVFTKLKTSPRHARLQTFRANKLSLEEMC